MSENVVWPYLLIPVLYGGMVHLGVVTGQYAPAALLLVLPLGWTVLRRLSNREGAFAPALANLGLVALGLILLRDSLFEFFVLPPVLVPLALGVLFGVTLLPGRTPLVTQVSRIMKGEIDDRALRYTRQITWAWTLFFLGMALESALLARYANAFAWSVITNGVNYLLVVVFFLIEYRIRVRVFPEVDHPGFAGFLRALLTLDYRCLRIL